MAVRACEACKRVRGGRRHGADACATSVAGKHERDACRHPQLLRRHTHLAGLHLPHSGPCARSEFLILREAPSSLLTKAVSKLLLLCSALVSKSKLLRRAGASSRQWGRECEFWGGTERGSHLCGCGSPAHTREPQPRRWLEPNTQRGLGGKSLGMIKFLVLVNKQGQTRLARYYEEQSGVSLQERSAQVYARLCFERSGEHACVHPGQ